MKTNAVCHVARHQYRFGRRVPLHDHDFPEVCWLESGTILHETTSARHELTGGQGLLVSPQHRHGFRATRDDAVLINIAIAPETLAPLAARLQPPGTLAVWQSPSDEPIPFTVPHAGMGSLDSITSPRADQLTADAFFIDLFQKIRPHTGSALIQHGPAWLQTALQELAELPHLAAGLPALTDLSGRSREHCSRSIRSHYQCSPQELLRDLRLEWLAKHLSLTTTAFNHLCHEIGIVNITHMHKHFKLKFGKTPGEFRRQARKIA